MAILAIMKLCIYKMFTAALFIVIRAGKIWMPYSRRITKWAVSIPWSIKQRLKIIITKNIHVYYSYRTMLRIILGEMYTNFILNMSLGMGRRVKCLLSHMALLGHAISEVSGGGDATSLKVCPVALNLSLHILWKDSVRFSQEFQDHFSSKNFMLIFLSSFLSSFFDLITVLSNLVFT